MKKIFEKIIEILKANLKTIIFSVICLFIGLAIGFYIGRNDTPPEKIIIKTRPTIRTLQIVPNRINHVPSTDIIQEKPSKQTTTEPESTVSEPTVKEETSPVNPTIELDPTYNDAAIYLAKTVYGEARGCSKTEQAAVIWCILNRTDNRATQSPSDIIAVITAPSQFYGYSAGNPVTDELYALAVDVLARWQSEKTGATDVGRVLPKEYLYFYGSGGRNHFTTTWRGGSTWNWGLKSPYDE